MPKNNNKKQKWGYKCFVCAVVKLIWQYRKWKNIINHGNALENAEHVENDDDHHNDYVDIYIVL